MVPPLVEDACLRVPADDGRWMPVGVMSKAPSGEKLNRL